MCYQVAPLAYFILGSCSNPLGLGVGPWSRLASDGAVHKVAALVNPQAAAAGTFEAGRYACRRLFSIGRQQTALGRPSLRVAFTAASEIAGGITEATLLTKSTVFRRQSSTAIFTVPDDRCNCELNPFPWRKAQILICPEPFSNAFCHWVGDKKRKRSGQGAEFNQEKWLIGCSRLSIGYTKTDDDHDSGTESDDESAEIEELQKYMEQSIQLEDGSSGHSPSRRRSATAVLCQHTSFRQQQQPESQQPNNKSADRRRLLPQQQQQYHHHHLHQQHHPHHSSELLSGPAVVTALLTATSAAAGHQPPCCHVVGPSVVVGGSPVLLDSALPSDSDPNLEQHSSEEELEVINNRAGSAEKRKWSQANQRRARGARGERGVLH
ncbi:hypothetical protein HPB50_000322 [Hyalomma asiaticum]|uniref:Uncharacterized protein n=1 Tax=Hyalomma asiaticum TaxID=266040 RepID=A0ACB7RRT0_HYAAI|nr:hypothetical protein HPB50_000322 [Hyalomma asiaticum]